jgi:1-pyrroline-5-carboxylate dehydrogenase
MLTIPKPFLNEAIRTFVEPADRASIEAALVRARTRLGATYPLVIGGEKIATKTTTASVNPSHPSEVVGHVGEASLEQAGEAIRVATERFASWKSVPWGERAAFLVRAAALVRERRDDYNAIMVIEVGKSWIEADADTAEAIDFLEYYAREALRLANPAPLIPSPMPETNELRYLPLGVGAVIPPWNFAFAIMAGMTAAALVTGNTVVLKPSPDAAVVAAHFVDLMHELGLPNGVINYVPGDGPTVGEFIVTDPRVRFISFTGSKGVGLRINELAAKTPPGQKWIKRVVAELGGKDAIIVADDANLEEAAAGVVASAFGFAGQKCSACSRAIVDAKVYDRFLEVLVKKAAALVTGDPVEAATYMGPVINQKAVDRIASYIEGARRESRLVAGGKRLEHEGYFFEPTIFADVDPKSRLAQEEVFGPVLAVIKAVDFEDALRIANDTEYGLTGAVYSQDPARLDRAADEFFVGNLYLNRKCTGALVGVHPFGGFNLSGTDSKAGGYDYLLFFVQAKAIARQTG